MERILSFFDSPYLRLNLDTGNIFIAGQETGIASSVVAIGEGANAESIVGYIEVLKETRWDGVLSIESEAAPGKIEQSIEWLRKEIAR